jgi:hypothetical protein
VLSTFVDQYNNDIIKRELTATAAGLNLCGGPYFIKKIEKVKHYLTVDDLLNMVDCLIKENAPVSKLREWVSNCHISNSLAIEDMTRIIQILEEKEKNKVIHELKMNELLEEMKKDKVAGSPFIKTSLYDAITIDSLISKNFKYGRYQL